MHYPTDRLTEPQRSRVAMARADLQRARAADVGAMSVHDLILAFECTRNALDDALRLIGELAEVAPEP